MLFAYTSKVTDMKVKTNELIGPALDWAVAKCEGFHYFPKDEGPTYVHKDSGEWHHSGSYTPSVKWAQGGPIKDEERITLNYKNLDGTGPCEAYYLRTLFDDEGGWYQHGPTSLIAAMRCYVASKLGDEVDVPEELCG